MVEGMVISGLTGSSLAILGAIAVASLVVARMTPASLLASPERPFVGYGNPEVRMESPQYPRAATGADDLRVAIAAPPRRLVSQYSSTDEYLYAVVPPDRVVGVSESAYLRRLSNVYALAERYRPVVSSDVERVLRANPDLVFTPASARADMPGLLRSAAVPVYRIYTMFETLASIEAHIRLVGYLTGEDVRAEAEAKRFREVISRAAARRPAGMAPPRVLGFNGVYSYGSTTLFHDILRVLGAENVAATHGLVAYDRVTDERIVRWNPDWVVVGADRGKAGETRARMLAHPAFGATNAARLGQIVVLEHHVFLPLSPFTAALVEALSQAFYGGPS
jgi:iron complex transport system substrate-binding protein